MKKSLVATIFCCAAILSARDIADNLDRAAIGSKMIPGWTINKVGKAADYGKSEIVVGSEPDDKALKLIAPAKRYVAVYMLTSTPVRNGDFLEFSADVKGKGTVTFAYYTYNAKDRFIGVPVSRKTITLTNSWKEVKCKLPIKNTTGDKAVARIRPCITLSAGGELLIEDIDLEIDND